MHNIKTYNKISATTNKILGQDYTLDENIKDYEGILVRSANLLEENFSDNCIAIARVGAGVNNIPIDKCSEQGIAVFNTPGGNSNAVKELTIAGILSISRNIKEANEWLIQAKDEEALSKLIEKEKSKYVGYEILGKMVGVIGLGQVGAKVAKELYMLGMKVLGYDAYINAHQKQELKQYIDIVDDIDTLIQQVDYITLHMATTDATKGFINDETINKMKDGVYLINYARGELINHTSLVNALKSRKIKAYATDFPTKEEIELPHVLATPHLGASTIEAEENCAVMAATEIKEFIENGNINNSVNLPAVTIPRSSGARVTILHKNRVGMLEEITNKAVELKLNIDGLANKGRKDIAYTILDFETEVPADICNRINEIKDVIRVRVIE